MKDLLKTPLYDRHVSAGAKMGPDAGWAMPLNFGSSLNEASSTRKRAGIFDVSHLGRLRIRGDGALDLLERVCTADVAHQEDDTAVHTLLCNERGGILDECYLLRLENFWVLTTSADNREKILAHLQTHAADVGGVKIDDQTEKVSQLAAVGPDAEKILDSLLPISVAGLSPLAARVGSLMIANYIASRTSYSGGLYTLEVMVPSMFAGKAWDYVTKKGPDRAIQPAGMVARDILRMEAGLCRYGYEINEMTDPVTADLMKCVDLNHDFIGADAVQKFSNNGSGRRRVGLVFQPPADGKTPTAVPTLGTVVADKEGREVGNITSATFSPQLDRIIAQAYLVTDSTEADTELLVKTTHQDTAARVCKMPFVS